jgi:hypothetical protein
MPAAPHFGRKVALGAAKIKRREWLEARSESSGKASGRGRHRDAVARQSTFPGCSAARLVGVMRC